jgi:hypothetical protein
MVGVYSMCKFFRYQRYQQELDGSMLATTCIFARAATAEQWSDNGQLTPAGGALKPSFGTPQPTVTTSFVQQSTKAILVSEVVLFAKVI